MSCPHCWWAQSNPLEWHSSCSPALRVPSALTLRIDSPNNVHAGLVPRALCLREASLRQWDLSSYDWRVWELITMATLFECPQYLEQTSGRASGDFLVALQPLVSYFPIRWWQSHSKSVLWRHVCKTGGFVQLLLRLFYGSKRVYEYKGTEHGWEFQERGLWGNLGWIPVTEPRSKRDIWDGESIHPCS